MRRHDYTGLTGKKLLKAVTRRNRHAFIKKCIYTPAALLIAVSCIWFIKDTGNYASGIIVMLIAVGLAIAFGMDIPRHFKRMLDADDCALFRTHGLPEEIAYLIEKEAPFARLDDEGTLICPSFIMLHGDFESFKRLDRVELATVRIFKKHGVPQRLYLDVTDTGGDTCHYPLKLKHLPEAEEFLRNLRREAYRKPGG